jgi:peptidoglycan LD-endopeptidase CwlK
MSTRVESLAPRMIPLVQKMERLLKERGIRYAITCTTRTQAEQDALHAQGRNPLDQVNALRATAGMQPISQRENKNIVTNATRSPHQDGNAVDIVPLGTNGQPTWAATTAEWEAIGKIGEEVGLEWGGRWKDKAGKLGPDGLGWDKPHYQLKA